MRTLVLVAAALAAGACSGSAGDRASASTRAYGFGRAPTAAELAAVDIDAAPDGHGLPAGRGTVVEGKALYQAQCQMCHGATGEGMAPAFPALIGRKPEGEGFPFAKDPKIEKTIGNYWPHATTLFDYIRRAMPHTAPGSLTNDQVYALTAYLLAANTIIGMDAALDSAALMRVRMPYADRFVVDDRRGGKELK
jgi:mono/diheme cytochrome c family protein